MRTARSYDKIDFRTIENNIKNWCYLQQTQAKTIADPRREKKNTRTLYRPTCNSAQQNNDTFDYDFLFCFVCLSNSILCAYRADCCLCIFFSLHFGNKISAPIDRRMMLAHTVIKESHLQSYSGACICLPGQWHVCRGKNRRRSTIFLCFFVRDHNFISLYVSIALCCKH